jgi:YesN/AraC family two-component response regulator
MKIKVMIVDDQVFMREGLKTILDLEDDISVISLAENGEDALAKIRLEEPEVVLMDIRMPVMDGVECTAAVKREYPHIKIIILTTFDDDEYIINALGSGAEGYLLKDLPSEELIGFIREVYKGNRRPD